jgi:hypothetical protein
VGLAGSGAGLASCAGEGVGLVAASDGEVVGAGAGLSSGAGDWPAGGVGLSTGGVGTGEGAGPVATGVTATHEPLCGSVHQTRFKGSKFKLAGFRPSHTLSRPTDAHVGLARQCPVSLPCAIAPGKAGASTLRMCGILPAQDACTGCGNACRRHVGDSSRSKASGLAECA